MTCIVALKEGNRIWLGADSCISGSYESTIGKPKIVRKGEFLLGGAGSVRGIQLFQHSMPILNICEGEEYYHYLINTITHSMRQTFKVHGFLREEDKKERAPGTNFILIFRGEIYEIDSFFGVDHSRVGYSAIGNGDHFALGSLYSTAKTNLDPETRIKIALDAASNYSGYVAPPYEILSIEWKGFEHEDEYMFYDSDGTTKRDKLINDFPKEEKDNGDKK